MACNLCIIGNSGGILLCERETNQTEWTMFQSIRMNTRVSPSVSQILDHGKYDFVVYCQWFSMIGIRWKDWQSEITWGKVFEEKVLRLKNQWTFWCCNFISFRLRATHYFFLFSLSQCASHCLHVVRNISYVLVNAHWWRYK